jgi:hypothetical protein
LNSFGNLPGGFSCLSVELVISSLTGGSASRSSVLDSIDTIEERDLEEGIENPSDNFLSLSLSFELQKRKRLATLTRRVLVKKMAIYR